MDFENEIEKILTYLNPDSIKELAKNTNSQCLWFYPDLKKEIWVSVKIGEK